MPETRSADQMRGEGEKFEELYKQRFGVRVELTLSTLLFYLAHGVF